MSYLDDEELTMLGYPDDTVLAAAKATPGPLWIGILFAVVVVVGLIFLLLFLKGRGR